MNQPHTHLVNVRSKLAFGAGLVVMGLCWLVTDVNTDPPTPKQVPIIVPDTEYRTVTKEVDQPPSTECTVYLDATQQMRDGQAALSQAKGAIQDVAYGLHRNLQTQDPLVVKQLEHQLEAARNQMDAAWLTIGDAAATLDKYEPGHEPCR